jgi:hypothetical protein
MIAGPIILTTFDIARFTPGGKKIEVKLMLNLIGLEMAK